MSSLRFSFRATIFFLMSAFAVAQQAPNFTHNGSYGPVPNYVQDFISADLNHDGHTDMIELSSNGSSTVNVFMNNGNGGFTGPISTDINPGASKIAVGDFNRDGNLDLAVAIYGQGIAQGEVQVLTGDGAGHFTGITTYNVASEPNSIAVGDFNGDGAFDIAVLSENSKKVSLLLNNGSGGFSVSSFAVPTYFDTTGGGQAGSDRVSDLVAGDFNGDGRMDLAYVDHCGDGNICPVEEERIYTLTRTSTGTFTPALLTQASSGLRHLHSADIDMDGKSDLYYGYAGCHTPCYGVVALFSNGGNNFSTTNVDSGNTGYSPYDVVVGDFNNDGLMDIAFSGIETFSSTPNGMAVVIQTSPRHWSSSEPQFWPPTASRSPQQIIAGFFSNPNVKDLAYIDYSGIAEVFRNSDGYANGTCQYAVNIAVQICLPGSGVTTSSPVRVQATYHPQNYPAHRIEIWLDGSKKKQVYNDRVDSSFALAAGTHTLTVAGVDMTNRALKNTYSFTVGGSIGCSAPSSAGAHICSPTAGSSVSSPVTISAAARASSGNITAMRIYVDSVSTYTQNNSSASTTMQLTKSLSLRSGPHNLTVVGYQSTGGAVKASETITVK